MKIESDTAQILSGVRWGKTLSSPITLLIDNKDGHNWQKIMSVLEKDEGAVAPVTRPRPGHADLAGVLKYGHRDIRNVLERSSARETAARVAVGAIARKFLSEFDIRIMSYVTEINGIAIPESGKVRRKTDIEVFLSRFNKAEKSPVRCSDKKIETKMIEAIDKAVKTGNSLGGVFEVIAAGVPAGLGSYSQWDRKLDARLAYAFMGIQAIKGVEIGLGFEMARKPGSKVMDEIYYKAPPKQPAGKQGTRQTTGRRLDSESGQAGRGIQTKEQEILTAGGFYRKTNNAGGIEGGMSNGMPLVVRAAMKPIPTLRTPLSSVDIISKKTFKAAYERSDVCAVPAASVIGEAVIAIVIAGSFLEKFGGDSMKETKRNYKGYLKQIREF